METGGEWVGGGADGGVKTEGLKTAIRMGKEVFRLRLVY